MPLLLAAVVAALSSWVPMRWWTSDPASLELVKGGPVNCLLLEPGEWSREFSTRAREAGIVTVGLVNGAWDDDAAQSAGLAAIVTTGAARPSKLPVYSLPDRSAMVFEGVALAGTTQGVWPGVNPVDEDHAKAAPSGAPWIDTNSGFLRFARALTTAPLWIANVPPPGRTYPVTRYLQAAGEAAMCGARWVVALDADFRKRLTVRDPNALRDWGRLTELLQFQEAHRAELSWAPAGKLTLIQDTASGALLSGGIMDMVASRHTPVRPVPPSRMGPEQLQGSAMAVNVDPSSLTASQRQALAGFTRTGGTVLTGPADWKFPAPREGQVTLDEKDVQKLDSIWKEVNTLMGRRNLGVRLFNAGTMLSNLTRSPDGSRQLLQLVNYTDFRVESITVHALGKWKKATLFEPGRPGKALEMYPTEEGTGIDIPDMGW